MVSVLVCVPLQRSFCLSCGGLSFFFHLTHGIDRSGRRASERARRDVGLGEAVAREEAQNVGGLGSAVPMDSGHLCGAAGIQGVRLVGILGGHLVRLQVRETATEGA